MKWEKYLKSIYFNVKHPASFSGIDKLYHFVKKDNKFDLNREQIKLWLEKQESYALYKPSRKQFKRRRVIVGGVDDQWSFDLADVTNISKYNDSFNFLLVVIDIFSRYLWIVPIKRKTAEAVITAFKSILLNGKRKPRKVNSDKGLEFTNKAFKLFFKKNGIKHFVMENSDIKANYAERVIKTVKSKLYRYFMENETYRYIDILPDIVSAYNSSYHSSIGMPPKLVNSKNESELWMKQYGTIKKHRLRRNDTLERAKFTKNSSVFKYKVGDFVRISHLRYAFSREYHTRWTGEFFKITKRFVRQGFALYELCDYANESITESFYDYELERAHVNENNVYKVSEVVKTRKRKGVKEHLIRWKHWPQKFDSWVNASEVSHLNQNR